MNQPIMHMPRRSNQLRYPFSLLLCLLLSFGIWIIFQPGLYSSDSLNMAYESALSFFNDLHSTLLPFTVWLVLRAGDSFGLVTFAQSLTGFLGLRALILALVRFIGGPERQADWMAVLIVACLASPLTLFSLFILTLWNDTWLAILLLWLIALLLSLYQDSELRKPFSMKLGAVVLLGGLALVARQNALVVFPALALALGIILRRKSIPWIYSLAVAFIPLVIYISYAFIQYDVVKVKRTNPEGAVYALDLASMIVYDPTLCNNLSITSCDLVLGVFPPKFIPGKGAIDLTSNQGAPPHFFFLDLMDYPELGNEFVAAARDHSLLLATVKLLNFLDYLRPDATRYFYQRQMYPNSLGLAFDLRFSELRLAWFSAVDWSLANGIFRWFSYVHAVWLISNLLGVLTCGYRYARLHDEHAAFLGVLLLVPASYYASYLIALTASEFRFMYPATLITQVVSLTLLAASLEHRLGLGKGRQGWAESALEHRPD